MANVLEFRKPSPAKEIAPARKRQFSSISTNSLNAGLVWKLYGRRKEVLTPFDIRNAEHRAEWTRKYFSGHFCDDLRSPEEQARYAHWHHRAMREAHKFLRGTHGG